jgi:hypothetical protein
VTSPNEPGHPGLGDSPNGNGVDRGGAHRSEARPAHGRASDAGSETGGAPPWQRGGPRPSSQQHRPPSESQGQPEGRSGHSPGVEARLTRFISGTAAPGASATPQGGHAKTPEPDAPPARGDSRLSEAYASELPDLSGPAPRPAPRKPMPDRAHDTSPAPGAGRPTSRIHVASRPRGPVRASMQIRRIDPWSTLKVSLVLSVALFFVWMIAVAFLYLVLGGMGVWSKLNSNVGDLLNNAGGSSAELVSSGTIFGGAVLIGLMNIVLLTAMATIGAFVYNLTTDLIGGIEVTLADRD